MTAGYDWTTENLIDGERGTMHIGRAMLSREVTDETTLSAGYVGALLRRSHRRPHLAGRWSSAGTASWRLAPASACSPARR